MAVMTASVFSATTNRQLEAAVAICLDRGTRMTSLRRQVLGLVLETGQPATAYDLLDRLRELHKGAAPPTIYRALDFLLEQGLVHKVERLSAYVGCVHAHGHMQHAAQFLICRQCGRVMELEDAAIRDALGAAALRQGFRPLSSTVEIEGLCAECLSAESPAASGSIA